MSTRFSFTRRALSSGNVLELHGELDLARVDEVEAELERLHVDSPEQLVVDLRGLTFLDSSGLRMLIVASGRARDRGQRLALVRGVGQVQQVFQVTGMERQLPFVDEPTDEPPDPPQDQSG